MVLQGPDKGQRFRVKQDRDTILIGRASDATPLTDYTVSRRHAELKRSGRSWMLDDLRSANGTYLNEKRLERPTRLKDGDKIRMGATILVWDGSEGETVGASSTIAADFVDLDAGGTAGGAIIGTVSAGDDSMILASPAAAEAVRSWRVISTLLDAVGAALTPTQLTQRVLDLVFEEVPADRGFILLHNEKTGKMDLEAIRALDEKEDRVRAGRNIVDHVVEKREGVLCSNAMSDSRFAGP